MQARALLLAGGQSDAFPPDKFEQTRATLPNCQAVMLEGASHFFPFEHPARVVQAVNAFLA
jgi:pimeloyl-ACP methyl ester carboxylesterase